MRRRSIAAPPRWGLEQLARGNGLALGDAQARQLQRFGETFRPKRLEQIVHRMHFEGAQCVIVMGGREHDAGGIAADELQYFETVQFRHLNIQKQQVRLQFVRRLHRLQTIGAFGHHPHVAMVLQIFPDQRASRSLIVDYHHGEL